MRLRIKRLSNIFEDKENIGVVEFLWKGKRWLVKLCFFRNFIDFDFDGEFDSYC